VPKLPKDLQNKRKQQIARAKGSAGSSKAGSSRAMRRKLAQQGIDAMDEIPANRVIIQCDDKNIVIENPQVIALTQQGMTVHQIIGESKEYDLDEDIGVSPIPSKTMDSEDIAGSLDIEPAKVEELANPSINDTDIMIVASQAGVSQDKAKKALEEANGDLARAILSLKTR